jgi:DNA polymerase-3 subunit epsilon
MSDRFIVLDTETTGLGVQDGHRIIEIGCVEIANRRISGKTLHQYLDPEREIDEGAMQVHGLTLEMLQGKPLFADVADDFLAFVNGADILIHNASFDVGFLDAELSRIKRPAFAEGCGEIIDTLAMARELHPGRRNSLDALCDRYGISNAHRKLHGALLDAELLADVYLAMTRGQDSLVMAGNDEEQQRRDLASGAWPPSGLVPASIDADEAAAHQAYLESMAKDTEPVWSAEGEA